MIALRDKLLASCLALLAAGSALASGVDVEGGLTRAFTTQPGKRIEGTIVLRNGTDKPREVRAYQTDYLFSSDGKNVYGEPGSAPRSNCAWITFSPRQFIVPANGTSSIYYAIKVPDGENMSGTYWSMLMIEPLAEGGLETSKAGPGKVTMGVQTVMRYGIQIVTNLGDSGKREIRFADKQLLSKDGKWVLQLDIENTGERWLRPSVRAEFYDYRGSYIGSFQGDRSRIYPGCSVRVPIELTSLPAGKYSALVVLDNGDESVWGAQYEIEIK